MRLTLRTMLAYLDEILDPSDSEEIGHKIQESEFAGKLMHRTRECLRRLRLGAPPVVGRGNALDPNTVAEYLDNTLATERVPDFERICLESDVHLAEVAACHQILTLVLGEPAEVDPQSRERMYKLGQRVDAKHSLTEAQIPPKAAPAKPAAVRPRVEIPEYLREPDVPVRRRWLVLAATIAAAALLTIGGLALVGPKSIRDLAARVTGWGGQPQPKNAAHGGAGSTADKPLESQPDHPATRTSADEQPPDAKPADSTPAQPAQEATLPAADTEPPDMPEEKPTTDETPAAEPTEPTAEPTERPAAAVPAPTEPARPRPGERPAQPDGTPQPVGRYLAERDVLLRFDPESGDWGRLAQQSALTAGDRLLALPAFKPQLTLATGVTVQLFGPASVTLLAPDQQGRSVIDVAFGQVRLLTNGRPGGQIVVRFGQRQGVLTFDDPESTAAVELRRRVGAGEDPEHAAAEIEATLMAVQGAIHWELDGPNLEMPSPSQWSTAGGGQVGPLEKLPDWTDPANETRRELDRRAATILEQAISLDRAVSLSLKELAERPQKEVKSLAVRSCLVIGRFDPFVAALGDSDHRAFWLNYVESARAAIAQSPDQAALAHAALKRGEPVAAEHLFRMLWGYSPEQLRQGRPEDPAANAAVQLVEYLDHEQLKYRVLAFACLREITGKTQGYLPEHSAPQRRITVQKWKDQLAEGKIAPPSAAAAPPRRDRAAGDAPLPAESRPNR